MIKLVYTAKKNKYNSRMKKLAKYRKKSKIDYGLFELK